MNMQEEQKNGDHKPAEQATERADTDRDTSGTLKSDERSVPSDKEINLSDEDQALDSGI
jgi:hypothetical protein